MDNKKGSWPNLLKRTAHQQPVKAGEYWLVQNELRGLPFRAKILSIDKELVQMVVHRPHMGEPWRFSAEKCKYRFIKPIPKFFI